MKSVISEPKNISERMIDHIHKFYPRDLELDDHVWSLTGSGESKIDCGTFFQIVQKSIEHRLIFKHGCGKRSCQICSDDWGKRQAQRACNRTYALAKIMHYKHEPRHVIISFPPNLQRKNYDGPKLFTKLRKKISNAILKHTYQNSKKSYARIRGFWMTFHPARWKDSKPYFSPHFHLICFGWLDTQAIAKELNCVVKVLGSRLDEDKEQIEKQATTRIIRYLCSHTCLNKQFPKKRSIWWFGDLAYNQLTRKIINQKTVDIRDPNLDLFYEYNANVSIHSIERISACENLMKISVKTLELRNPNPVEQKVQQTKWSFKKRSWIGCYLGNSEIYPEKLEQLKKMGFKSDEALLIKSEYFYQQVSLQLIPALLKPT